LLAAFLDPFLLAIAGGIGSAVGEISGYLFGYYGHKMIGEERQRKMEFMVKFLDHYGPVAVFLFALTPLPDDILFIPLGMMRFSFLKVFIPCVLGKISMCFIVAYSGRYSVEFIRTLFGDGGWLTGIITALLLVAIIVAMFKIDWEKMFNKYVNTGEPNS
jgi:membrane protein YqaA with SNARE-associated domain